MGMPGTLLTLLIGSEIPTPPSPYLMEALDSIEVTQTDHGPQGFQMTFHADRNSLLPPDYNLLFSQDIAVGRRVIIIVTLSASLPRVLMDGFITHMQMNHDKPSGAATITVTGEDVSIKMDLTEESTEAPGLGHFLIVEERLAKYMLYGVIPLVIPTPTSLIADPLERVEQQQNITDREYINNLAAQHGYVFQVRPGMVPMTNIAYWGPPVRIGIPQATLTVDMGGATNVESISFQYNGLAPVRYTGTVQDDETELDIPIDTLFSTRFPPLALKPALQFNGGMLRTKIFDCTGMGAIDAEAIAQGMTDKSTDEVVTASGELDTLRYGSILKTPGLVGLRGCGMSFDGFYYVSAVTHKLKRGEYRQSFTLSREGLMSDTPLVWP